MSSPQGTGLEMDAQRWRRIDELFNALVDRTPAERDALLVRTGAGDSDLRAEVESLLTAHARGSSFIDLPAFDVVVTRPDAPSAAHAAGQRIGRYTVRSILGVGGMGVVYEAEQEQPRRTVALKVIRPGLATPSMLRRFEHEAEHLGRLQHPGIAQIFDAGTAETNIGPQSYLAMELVRGEPITRFAAAAKLTIRQRIELFIRVCDAVAHAHQNGVIHRDLKPSNILVHESGQPKVLDFGIARSNEPNAETSLQTEAGQLLGTVAYMSPEQVRGRADGIDVRSDVYSLGVVLYELLAGRHPYELSDLALPELARVICEQAPRPLGAVHLGFRGDLDTIVLKALEKDPDRRYASAAALRDDLARYLNGQAVLAHPPSTSYQIRMLVTRHRIPFALVSALFVVIVGSAITTGWLALKFQNQRDVAREERSRAAVAQTTAENVAAFLEQLFEQADPGNQATADPKVRDLLAVGLAKLEAELGDQPLVRARLQGVIGSVYARLGDYEKSLKLLESSITMIREQRGSDHPDLIDPLNRLATAQLQVPAFAQAEKARQERLQLCERHFGPRSEQSAGAHEDLGAALHYAGDFDGAERHYLQALEIRLALFGQESAEVAQCLHNLGWAQLKEGRLDAAEESLQNALRLRRKLLGTHAFVALTLEALAHVAFARGKPELAQQYLAEQLEIVRHVHHATHPEVARVLNNLGFLVARNCGPADAEPVIREALSIRRAAFGDRHPDVAVSLSDLAFRRSEQGAFDDAIKLYLESLEIRRAAFGENADLVGDSLRNLGEAYRRSGQTDLACSYLLQSYDVFVGNHGAGHPTVIPTIRTLVAVYQQLELHEEAQRWQALLPNPEIATSQSSVH